MASWLSADIGWGVCLVLPRPPQSYSGRGGSHDAEKLPVVRASGIILNS